MKLSVKEVKITNLPGQMQVEKVLYACGRDMAKKYDIHQWDNNHIKTMAIVVYCELKNKVFLVVDGNKKAVGTFQIRVCKEALSFEKLGTLPQCQGYGIAGKMLEEIRKIAKDNGCSKITCSVYEKNRYALEYYLKKGFSICQTTQTKKYKLINMEMDII